MIPLAPHISAFLHERLPKEKRASRHTCDSYAHAFQRLFKFASDRLKVSPSSLHVEHIDAPLVSSFLEHLETERENSPKTRNARLAAIRSFMRFLEHRAPAALDQIRRVLAIPFKKADSRLINHLTQQEMGVILNAPDISTRDGLRDRAMLYLAFTCGLRVSELVGLRVEDVTLQPTASVLVRGKGRKERSLPLWKQAAVTVRAWLAVRGDAAVPELFLNARHQHLSRAGFEYILEKHVKSAVQGCPTLLKKRVSPHVLRHTCAMNTLRATGDLRKVALWLGHASLQTTEIYTRADDVEKLEILATVKVPKLKRGKFGSQDELMASLRAAMLCGATPTPRPPGAATHPPNTA
jgi:site-specific recombinase XerD